MAIKWKTIQHVALANRSLMLYVVLRGNQCCICKNKQIFTQTIWYKTCWFIHISLTSSRCCHFAEVISEILYISQRGIMLLDVRSRCSLFPLVISFINFFFANFAATNHVFSVICLLFPSGNDGLYQWDNLSTRVLWI